jgi:hypothetical protein
MTKVILLMRVFFVGVDQNEICVRGYKNVPIMFLHSALKIRQDNFLYLFNIVICTFRSYFDYLQA